MKYSNKQFEVKSTIKDKAGEVKDDFTKVLSDVPEELDEWLKYLGGNIDIHCEDVKEYLSERMDYREIFRK